MSDREGGEGPSQICQMQGEEHRSVAERLDRKLGPGGMDSTRWLAFHWLREHAPSATYEAFLRWAHKVAPLPADENISGERDMTPSDVRKIIRRKALMAEINDIAKAHIPDFHFLDYQVSTSQTCDRSPIGMCVWRKALEPGGWRYKPMQEWFCRYCGGPFERK